MPIYEYICRDCNKKISLLILNPSTQSSRCSKCSSPNLERIMSRFAAIRSEESRLESLADPSKWGDLDENDPKSMVKFIKKMGREIGDELGEDYDQLVEEAEEEAAKAASGQEDTSEE